MSYTDELLRGNISELQSRASNFTSNLNTAKLKVRNSESNGESFMRLETRFTKITEDTATLEAAGRERQERMWRIPQELFDSAVLADLAQSTELKRQLDQLFNDLESFKARARRPEDINRICRSLSELLHQRPSSQISRGNTAAGRNRRAGTGNGVERRVHVRAHTRKWPERRQR